MIRRALPIGACASAAALLVLSLAGCVSLFPATKPVQLYEFVEALAAHGPYIELFGRVNNQREGWLTVGNEAVEYQIK